MRLLTACLCALLLSTPALAGEDEPAKPKEAPKKAEPVKPPLPPVVAPDDVRTRMKKDIEELVRRGGALPEGYKPSAFDFGKPPAPPARAPAAFGGPDMNSPATQRAFTRAMGKIILKYLAEKQDAKRAAVYEDLLKQFGTVMASEDNRGFASLMPRLMGSFLQGMQDPDPTRATVYREILQILHEAHDVERTNDTHARHFTRATTLGIQFDIYPSAILCLWC